MIPLAATIRSNRRWRHSVEHGFVYATAKDAFKVLWDYINHEHPWSSNPWVWRIEFERKESNT